MFEGILGKPFKVSLTDLVEPITGIVTTYYGKPATGKTNILLFLAVKYAQQGKKVLFIDVDGGFSIARIKQMLKTNAEKALNNIYVASPRTFEDQIREIKNLRKEVEKDQISLVIVDSIILLYRLELGENFQEVNRELGKQLAELRDVARTFKIPIIVTNQVREWNEQVEMVGGDILKYWSKVIFKTEKTSKGYNLSVLRHITLPQGVGCDFRITDAGLEEVV
ncbi:MAG: DNA repair and recombination protein RadB [Euryarchaeota archaeon HGW-Euryarchaeota-1]|nr:MAG: DNA repair and recombination protein RadB [Euryarchaeota archaeon HGW-Euryarchaeota-1]